MNIIKKSPDKYGLQKVGKNCHRIVKVLKEYDNEQDAERDMVKLLTGEIKEQELIEGGKEPINATLNISKQQADLLRQWYNAVKDSNPGYLADEDDLLYMQIVNFLKEE
jgi:hypothetical protein